MKIMYVLLSIQTLLVAVQIFCLVMQPSVSTVCYLIFTLIMWGIVAYSTRIVWIGRHR